MSNLKECMIIASHSQNLSRQFEKDLEGKGFNSKDIKTYTRTFRYSRESNGSSSHYVIGLLPENMYQALSEVGYTKDKNDLGAKLSTYNFSKIPDPKIGESSDLIVYIRDLSPRHKNWVFNIVKGILKNLTDIGYLSKMPVVYSRMIEPIGEVSGSIIKIFFNPDEKLTHIKFVRAIFNNTPVMAPRDLPDAQSFPNRVVMSRILGGYYRPRQNPAEELSDEETE